MTIHLNGKDYETAAGATVMAVLETLGLAAGRVAVELNGRVIARADLGTARLRQGDVLEVVQFVGGG